MAIGLTDVLPSLHAVDGVSWGVAAAGLKKIGGADVALMALEPGSHCVAVYTQNAFCAAPVVIAKRHATFSSEIRYLLINSGNANAGTGAQGLNDAMACCQSVAEYADCSAEQVLPFSTGVIGEPLPVVKVAAALPQAFESLNPLGWENAANAIMTTDTVPKAISKQVEFAGNMVTVTGIAKGSGMIHPNMATMLAYVATDASVAKSLLRRCLDRAIKSSFNCITVDGDTSTNDACVLVATAKAGVHFEDESDAGFGEFQLAIVEVCEFLAQAIIRDAEGATKLMTLNVTGGKTEEECRKVADAVALSPLVKTAFFASDPNWGRILAAVGRAGIENLDINNITIHLGDVCIVRDGGRDIAYTEEAGQAVMDGEEITVTIDLKRGKSVLRLWSCDFSYDYVKINAEYRT